MIDNGTQTVVGLLLPPRYRHEASFPRGVDPSLHTAYEPSPPFSFRRDVTEFKKRKFDDKATVQYTNLSLIE
jgi:hypothetical protein